MNTTLRNNGLGIVALLSAITVGVLSAGCGTGNGAATPAAAKITATQVVKVPASFTTIDGTGGSPTTINGISNNGALVGFTTNNGVNSNFLRDAAGSFVPLSIGDPAGMANGVNKSNAVAGVANNNGFLLANGTQTVLLPSGAQSAIAFGINDAGVIVGQYTAAGKTPGFVLVNGSFTPINPTAAATVTNVQGVNNKNQAIGFYSADGVHQHGFLYNIATQQVTLLPDPSTPRIVAGGLVLTQFLGINDNGEAVGYYQTNNGSQFGFLFDLNTNTYTFLDDPLAAPVNGVQITQITGVANTGEITGFYIDANGVQHGFLALPSN